MARGPSCANFSIVFLVGYNTCKSIEESHLPSDITIDPSIHPYIFISIAVITRRIISSK